MHLDFQQKHKAQNKLVNKKIVKIQLSNKNDIVISWNFNGLLNPKVYRRHVFLCSSSSETCVKQTFQILEKCYEFFKNGDIYTMGFFESKRFTWNEKTKVDKLSMGLFDFKYHKTSQKPSFHTFTNLLANLSKYRDPTIVFLNLNLINQIANIEGIINQLRQKNKLNCLFMIYGPAVKENTIQFSKGICYLCSDKINSYDIAEFYKYYDQRLACLQAQIIIQSMSGDIFLKKGVWTPLEFSSFRRKIYYPLSCNLTDIIETFKLCNQKNSQWKFKFFLNYKLLNGDTFSAAKEIVVPLIPGIQESVTCNRGERCKKILLCWGIELDQNPFDKQFSLQPGI